MICTDDTRRVWCAPGVCSPPPSLCVRVRRALDRVPIVQSRVARRASRHRPCDVLSLHVPSCAVLHTAPRRPFCVHAPRLRRSALERDPRTVLDPSSVMCAAGEREVATVCRCKRRPEKPASGRPSPDGSVQRPRARGAAVRCRVPVGQVRRAFPLPADSFPGVLRSRRCCAEMLRTRAYRTYYLRTKTKSSLIITHFESPYRPAGLVRGHG
jgi:hypothetical protein